MSILKGKNIPEGGSTHSVRSMKKNVGEKLSTSVAED